MERPREDYEEAVKARTEGYTERADMEIIWGSVLYAEKKLAEVSGRGFMVFFDPETGSKTFKVYKGVERLKDLYAGYVGYFGTNVGNIQLCDHDI